VPIINCATAFDQVGCVKILCDHDCSYFYGEANGVCITPNRCRCFYKSEYCDPDDTNWGPSPSLMPKNTIRLYFEHRMSCLNVLSELLMNCDFLLYLCLSSIYLNCVNNVRCCQIYA
jgi:hypothetical protein